ncbi:MAG: hypothetical protein ABH835_01695 [Patescibacteria group bacterium]|nr:hypothetical protein [Patescibacteria group bacterium]
MFRTVFVLFTLPLFVAACAHGRALPSVWVEFCSNHSCYNNDLLEEGIVYENCLVTDAKSDDTCWQEVECLHPTGQTFSGPITEFNGNFRSGDKVACQAMPMDSGMQCWSQERRASPEDSFPVFFTEFAADLQEAGIPLEKGTIYNSCWLLPQGMVSCYHNNGPFFSSTAGSVMPKGFPLYEDLACEVSSPVGMRCRASPIY